MKPPLTFLLLLALTAHGQSPPTPMALVTAPDTNTMTLTASWNSVSNATDYLLHWETNALTNIIITPAISATISNMPDSLQYDFQVQASNSAGVSPLSSNVYYPPLPLTNVSVAVYVLTNLTQGSRTLLFSQTNPPGQKFWLMLTKTNFN